MSFAAPLCYTHVTSPGTFQDFFYKHVHLHVSSFSLWDFPSKSCFKPNQAQSWVDDLLSLVSQNGKSSWMRKRKDLLGFHFYDPSIQVWQEFCDHFLSQRTMVAMMPPAKAKTNCSWTPAAPKRRVTIWDSGNENCSILQPINLDPPLSQNDATNVNWMSLISNCAQRTMWHQFHFRCDLKLFHIQRRRGDSIPIIFHPFLRARIPVILVHTGCEPCESNQGWAATGSTGAFNGWSLMCFSSLSSTIWIWPFVLLTHRRQTQQKLWWFFGNFCLILLITLWLHNSVSWPHREVPVLGFHHGS